MPGPLKNPKRELFAQELAKGAAQLEAARAAGYTGDKTAACHMAANADVRARVVELQQRSARRTELTVASITDRLLSLADKGEKLGEAPGLSVARASLMDAAKLNGLVVDTVERIQRSPEERRARIEQLRAERDAAARLH